MIPWPKPTKVHWRPLTAVSWPSGRMRTFHTGYDAVCNPPRGALKVEREIAFVTCGTCIRIASRARFDETGEPVPCVIHTDCRGTLALAKACAASRTPPQVSNSLSKETP